MLSGAFRLLYLLWDERYAGISEPWNLFQKICATVRKALSRFGQDINIPLQVRRFREHRAYSRYMAEIARSHAEWLARSKKEAWEDQHQECPRCGEREYHPAGNPDADIYWSECRACNYHHGQNCPKCGKNEFGMDSHYHSLVCPECGFDLRTHTYSQL